MAEDGRYTICVDLDGVLHAYASPWVNAWTIPDQPVDGAIDWLFSMVQRFDVVIFSTRCNSWRGRRAVRSWLRGHAGLLWYPSPDTRGIEEVKTRRVSKPPALLYLDDRAWRFDGPGSFPSVDQIHRARPWNKTQERKET